MFYLTPIHHKDTERDVTLSLMDKVDSPVDIDDCGPVYIATYAGFDIL